MVAITDSYATHQEYRARIDKASNSDDPIIQDQLKAKSRYIDSLTGGRAFSRDATAVARVYVPKYGVPELDVDDLVSVTTIKIDTDNDGSFADESSFTAYELLPRDALLGPALKPYRTVRKTTGVWTTGLRVEITGIWGHPSAVPLGIKYAVIDLVAIDRGEADEALSKDEIEKAVIREFGLVTL